MITWSSEYETGIAFVDRDHRKLVQGLNDLETALNGGHGSAQIRSVLTFLENYATQHFSREEGCMVKHECPTALANKTAHVEFLTKLREAGTRLDNSGVAGAFVARQIHRDLSDWIVTHILRIDMALKKCAPPAR